MSTENTRTFLAVPGRTVYYTLAEGVVTPALILDVDEDLQAVDLLVWKKHEHITVPSDATMTSANTLEHFGCVAGHDPGTWFPPPIYRDGEVLEFAQVSFLPAPVAEAVEQA